MKKIVFLLISLTFSYAQNRTQDFNFGWKFELQKDAGIPKTIPAEDKNWVDVRLPHDWSVEFSFDESLEGCTGYLPGGVGIYQKHFKTPIDVTTQKAFVNFDGVYNNATFWLNEEKLGENPYGYSPMYFDLTEKLHTDGTENILTVHVDHSRYADSRWYTGSGIYRNVKLVITPKLHIPIWGTYLTTPIVSGKDAYVSAQTTVKNDRSEAVSFVLKTEVFNSNNDQVASKETNLTLGADEQKVFTQEINVVNPDLWRIENPNIYHAITKIVLDDKTTDTYKTRFGFRKIYHKKDEGFYLNDVPTFVKGVCLHHDGGLVGAAVPKGVWKRRLQALKESGVNAIRTSHNPFSEEFYDLCDEMGFLVQAEIFDEFDNPKDKRFNLNERASDYITEGYTNHFQKWGKSDLTRTMLRDRNHPSIFEWSIGNEIEWTYEHYKHVSGLWDPGTKSYWNRVPDLSPEEMKARYESLPYRKYKLTETAKKLADWTRELDDTRPVTANLIIPVASLASGYADVLDIVGFSYQVKQYNWSKKHYPNLHFTGNENAGTWQEWNSIIEDPMVYSMYMWTGIDYLGEANQKWPQKGWHGDILDLAGFKKAGWDHFKSIWVNKPHIAIGTHPISDGFSVDELSGKVVVAKKALNWNNHNAQKNWNYKKGETIIVEVPTNLHKVELLLNGKSLGWRSLSNSPDRILRWAVPFASGTLVARGGFDGQKKEVSLQTTSEPVAIKLITDKFSLLADGYDVAHVVAQLVDKDGLHVTSQEAELRFSVNGDVKILGVDNGSNESTQDYQTDIVITAKGRALLLLQSLKDVSDNVTVKVTASKLKSNSIQVQIKQ